MYGNATSKLFLCARGYALAACVAFPAAAALAGCARRAEAPAGNAIDYEVRTFERRSAECVPNGPCAHIRIDYPEFTGGSAAVRESLQAWVFDCVLRSPGDSVRSVGAEAAMQSFLDGYAAFRKSFPTSQTAWDADRRVAQLPSPLGVCTLAARIFAYNGGAHPATLTRLASFDASNGRRLSPGDLLTPGSEAQLLQAAEEAFRVARKLPATASFADSGYWFKDGFRLPSEFAVTPQGFRFCFNEYEVAPYSMGPTDFTVPMDRLRGVIRHDGPLASLFAGTKS